MRAVGRGGLAGFYDRFVVPVAQSLEARFPPPFGKNCLVIGVKPD